jgi:ABC-2 type transport system ATP-binding protein
VQAERTARQTTLLVRGNAPVIDPDWESADVGLEEMVLAYMGQQSMSQQSMSQDAPPARPHLTTVGEDQ